MEYNVRGEWAVL